MLDTFEGSLSGPFNITATIYHPLFTYQPALPTTAITPPTSTTPSDTPTRGKRTRAKQSDKDDKDKDPESPEKRPRKGVLLKAPDGRVLCQPASGVTLASLLSKFKSGELKPYTFQKNEVPPIGKFVSKKACPPYMLGAQCDNVDCGYHLNITPIENIEGKEHLRANYTKFRAWVTSHQQHFVFTKAALKHPYFRSTEDGE